MTAYRRYTKCARVGGICRALSKHDDGVTAIEFALLAPVLLMLIMGVLEFSMISFTLSVMESATSISARLGKTGYVPDGLTRQQEIINSITDKTAGLLDPKLITVTTKAYSSFAVIGGEPCLTQTCGAGKAGTDYIDINSNGHWDADTYTSDAGGPGDVVVYTVTYPWPVMTPIMSAIIGGTYTITSRSVVGNEPYATTP